MTAVLLDSLIWWCGIVLELLVLFRGLQKRLVVRYPFFYLYTASVLFFSVPLYFLYFGHSGSYPVWYWTQQFITLVTGYGLLLEIFHHVLSAWPGAERIARTVGTGFFVAVFGFCVLYPLITSKWSTAETIVEFERDLRTVQAVLLLAILAAISYYGLPIGRNMRGMIIGYGLYIGVSLSALAIRSHAGPSSYLAWYRIQPLSFNIAALIWVITLWRYEPNPQPSVRTRFEMDYESLAAKTRNMVGVMRSYLVRSARP